MPKVNVAQVAIGDIDPNPFRNIDSYPLDEAKLELLGISYEKAGMWEGVIGRRKGNRVQIAFGHHRLEAAKRAKMKSVSVILKKLSDEEMLLYMGLENLEEYNTNFTVLLETWEAAVDYSRENAKNAKMINIARLLGWVAKDGKSLNTTARACSGALEMIKKGHFEISDFDGLNRTSVDTLVSGIRKELKTVKQIAAQDDKRVLSPDFEEKKTAAIVDSAKKAAGAVKSGNLSSSGIKDVIGGVVRGDKPEKKLPDIDGFMDRIVRRACDCLVDDALRRDLDGLVEGLSHPDINLDEVSQRRLEVVREALDGIASRAVSYRNDLTAEPKLVEIA